MKIMETDQITVTLNVREVSALIAIIWESLTSDHISPSREHALESALRKLDPNMK